MLEIDRHRRLKVGLFFGFTAVLFAIMILSVGRKQGLFVRHARYTTKFAYVGGLVPGAPVWLNGVVVGSVEEVNLPADPKEREISVVFRVRASLADRLRADSRVRIRTLGLLGDRYLELTSGSADQEVMPAGAEIASQEPTDLASVLSKGGDAMTNIVAVSASLRSILDRIERGEGLLGELTTQPESGRRAAKTLNSILEQADDLLRDIKQGKGVLGRLIKDPELERQLLDDLAGFARAARHLSQGLDNDLKRDDSMIAGLLRDPQGRERLQKTLEHIGQAAVATTLVGREIKEGKGTFGRLLNDEQYAKAFLEDLAALTFALKNVAIKLDNGKGSAAQFVNDPKLYEDLEKVVRGVEKSKVLSWLVRNRRAAGEGSPNTPTPTQKPS